MLADASQQRNDSRWVMTAEELEQCPSRTDGVSASEEKLRRKQTVLFIESCGTSLKLPRLPILVAKTYLNRFFAVQSLRQHDRFIVAQACLFLAAKVEERPVKLERLVSTCSQVRVRVRVATCSQVRGKPTEKKDVLTAERVLLYSINYDFDIVNLLPISYLEGLLRRIAIDDITQESKRFVEDSHSTSVGLLFTPKKIVSACVFLAFLYLRALPRDKDELKRVFNELNISKPSLSAICTSMAELYVEDASKHRLLADLHENGHIPEAILAKSTIHKSAST